MLLSISPFKNPIGLDISDHRIRFFQIHPVKFKTISKIQSYGEIDVPKGLIENGNIKDNNEIVALIQALFKKPNFGKVNGKYIFASLPDKKTFINSFSIPQIPDNEINSAVKWEIEKNIPVSSNNIYYDWRLISANKSEKDHLKILVSVAEQNLVNTYTDIIKQSGYNPIGFENESIALSRCLVPANATITKPIIIIDLGRSKTSFILINNGNVVYNACFEISGNEMTNIISTSLDLNFKDSEKAKIICGLDSKKGKGAIANILKPIVDRLIDKINENIYYVSSYLLNGGKVDKIITTGSVSKMTGLPYYLEKNLNIKVAMGNPFVNISNYDPITTNSISNYLSFTTAIGLALKV